MTFVLIHGAGDRASSWDGVTRRLQAHGHGVVAVDLPCEDEDATFEDYADTVVAAIGDRTDLVVVAHSLGGFTGTLVADRVRADLLVYVAGMVPRPGESAGEWWDGSGYMAATKDLEDAGDEIDTFLGDMPRADAEKVLAEMSRDQAGRPMRDPFPLEALPDIPTRYIAGTRDRFLPVEFARRLARERLGIEADEIDAAHCPYVSRPAVLSDLLETYRAKVLT